MNVGIDLSFFHCVMSCTLHRVHADVAQGHLLSLRFWYETKGRFSKDQMKEIEKVTLARIICDSSDHLETIPKNAFDFIATDEFSSCKDIPQLDMAKWKM